jgi:hypothetical protein
MLVLVQTKVPQQFLKFKIARLKATIFQTRGIAMQIGFSDWRILL